MRGADLLVETLAKSGVKTIFSLSGNQIMPIYDACIDAGIRIVHTRHEAAAVFMADAYAQTTGQPGIALVTAAPGFGNALGALFTARASESPVILLSGDAPVAQDGKGAFQEFDQIAASRPFTKLSFRPREADRLGDDMAKAMQVARSGRPGPVHMALPFDVVQAKVAVGVAAPTAVAPERSGAPAAEISAVKAALAQAAKPVILTGPLLNHMRAGNLTAELAEAVGAPVATMESPRGLNDPALGRLSAALAQADLVVALGKPVDYTLGFGAEGKYSAGCRFIVIDPEEGERARAKLNLGDRLFLAVEAAVEPFAEALIDDAHPARGDRQEWRRTFAELIAARNFSSAAAVPGDRISSLALAQAVADQIKLVPHPIVICDGGEFGQWAQAVLPTKARLINGTAGAIGGCLCYAPGVRAARPDATVFAVMGDGTAGFQFSEFETAARERLPFVAVIGNDRCWNAEHQIQLREYGPERLVGCQLSGARYDLAAEALGGHGEYVTRPDELAGALQRAVASGLPACVNVEIVGLPAPLAGGH